MRETPQAIHVSRFLMTAHQCDGSFQFHKQDTVRSLVKFCFMGIVDTFCSLSNQLREGGFYRHSRLVSNSNSSVWEHVSAWRPYHHACAMSLPALR